MQDNQSAYSTSESKTLIRLPAVIKKTGFSRGSIYNWMREGTFPRPIQLSPRSVAWIEEEINAWIEDRIHDRDELTACREDAL